MRNLLLLSWCWCWSCLRRSPRWFPLRHLHHRLRGRPRRGNPSPSPPHIQNPFSTFLNRGQLEICLIQIHEKPAESKPQKPQPMLQPPSHHLLRAARAWFALSIAKAEPATVGFVGGGLRGVSQSCQLLAGRQQANERESVYVCICLCVFLFVWLCFCL